MTFAFTLVVSRALGATEYGLIALLQSWSSFLEVALGLGLPMYVARAVVERDVSASAGGAERLLTRARLSTILVGTLVIAFVFAERTFLTQKLAPGVNATWLIWMAALLGLLRADIRLSSEGIKARYRPVQGIALQFVLLPAAMLGCLLIAALAGTRVSAYRVTILFLGLAAVVVLAGRALWQMTRTADLVPSLTTAEARVGPVEQAHQTSRLKLLLLRTRAPRLLWVFSLVDVAFPAVSLTLVGLLAGPADVGIFSVASRVTDFAGIGLAGVTSIYGPRFARAFVQSDQGRLRACIRSAQIWSLAIFLPICLACLAAPTTILRLFGTEFTSGATVLRILALGQLVNAATGSVGVYLQMARAEMLGVWIGVLSISFLAGSSVLLGNQMGLVGLSIAYALSIALKNGALFVAVHRLARDQADPLPPSEEAAREVAT